MKQAIKLSDHFTYKRLLLFSLPSIITMVFSSIYGIVDGFFVSNFAGEDAFVAVNLIMPFLMILGTVGFMFGAGGSALVSKQLGKGNTDKANQYFSLLVYTAIVISIILGLCGFIFIEPISVLLGAEGVVLDNCVTYGRIISLGLPFFVLQMLFQSFFVTSEKPKLSFIVTLIAGCFNMILDYFLVGLIPLGVLGAAIATVISQIIGGLIPLIYFFSKNNSLLRLGKTKFETKPIIKTVVNGSSEFMSNISMSLVGMIYNFQLLHYAGEEGVASYGVIMYISMIFAAAFIGYSIGTAPIVGFNQGAKNYDELKSLLRKSMKIIIIISLCMTLLSEVLAYPFSYLFVGYNENLLNMTINAFRIYSFAYLFIGIAIYSSGFFTALNDGVTSAIISFLRTLVFQIIAVLILPLIFNINGIWYSIIVAEFMAVVVSFIFLKIKQKKFNY